MSTNRWEIWDVRMDNESAARIASMLRDQGRKARVVIRTVSALGSSRNVCVVLVERSA